MFVILKMRKQTDMVIYLVLAPKRTSPRIIGASYILASDHQALEDQLLPCSPAHPWLIRAALMVIGH